MDQTGIFKAVRPFPPNIQPSVRQVKKRLMMTTYRRNKDELTCGWHLTQGVLQGQFMVLFIVIRSRCVRYVQAGSRIAQYHLIINYDSETHLVRTLSSHHRQVNSRSLCTRNNVKRSLIVRQVTYVRSRINNFRARNINVNVLPLLRCFISGTPRGSKQVIAITRSLIYRILFVPFIGVLNVIMQ